MHIIQSSHIFATQIYIKCCSEKQPPLTFQLIPLIVNFSSKHRLKALQHLDGLSDAPLTHTKDQIIFKPAGLLEVQRALSCGRSIGGCLWVSCRNVWCVCAGKKGQMDKSCIALYSSELTFKTPLDVLRCVFYEITYAGLNVWS